MSEIKIHELRTPCLQKEIDQQDMETLQDFQTETQVEIYLDRDEEKDEPVINPDGSVSLVRTVNINGIQYQIPVEVKKKIPASVYEVLKRSEDIRELHKPKPTNFVNYGRIR